MNQAHRQSEPLVVVKEGDTKELRLASKASPTLLKVKTSRLFGLYPDELIIEEKQIKVNKYDFPIGATLVTVPIERLSSVELSQWVFFSTIYIRGKLGEKINLKIHGLWNRDALKAKELIDGLRLKQTEAIEVVDKDKARLREAAQLMGKT